MNFIPKQIFPPQKNSLKKGDGKGKKRQKKPQSVEKEKEPSFGPPGSLGFFLLCLIWVRVWWISVRLLGMGCLYNILIFTYI